jgi:hypothetical protein
VGFMIQWQKPLARSSRSGFNLLVLLNLLKFVSWYPPSCYGICGSLWVMADPTGFDGPHLLNIMLEGRQTPN